MKKGVKSNPVTEHKDVEDKDKDKKKVKETKASRSESSNRSNPFQRGSSSSSKRRRHRSRRESSTTTPIETTVVEAPVLPAQEVLAETPDLPPSPSSSPTLSLSDSSSTEEMLEFRDKEEAASPVLPLASTTPAEELPEAKSEATEDKKDEQTVAAKEEDKTIAITPSQEEAKPSTGLKALLIKSAAAILKPFIAAGSLLAKQDTHHQETSGIAPSLLQKLHFTQSRFTKTEANSNVVRPCCAGSANDPIAPAFNNASNVVPLPTANAEENDKQDQKKTIKNT